MRIGTIILALTFAAPGCFAQLTADQKVVDFLQLSAVYAKNYAPYEWKKQVFNFDLLDVKPWLDKVRATKTDLEFLDVCTKYVASLNDSHDELYVYSDFVADLGVYVDIYDGKLLVDGIDRSLLPKATFPISIGDELVSLDGVPVSTLLDDLLPYSANGGGNAVTKRRLASNTLTYRMQYFMPTAPLVGDTAVAVFRAADGTEQTLELPWTKTGTPIMTAGPVPGPLVAAKLPTPRQRELEGRRTGNALRRQRGFEDGLDFGLELEGESAPYMKPLAQLRNLSGLRGPKAYVGFGDFYPLFDLPLGFRTRLGLRSTDYFLSGTYTSGDKKIGFVRIPDMSPASTNTALNQLASELTYLNANTDGLVVDLMGNAGGSGCYTEALVRLFMSQPFRSMGFEIRATQQWVFDFSSALQSAKNNGASATTIAIYQGLLDQVKQANSEMRGRTGALPLCSASFDAVQPFFDSTGKPIGYSKPVLLLTDEVTISAGELFASLLQDTGRATVFGKRTDGGGGAVVEYAGTTYSEAMTRVTISLMNRPKTVSTPGYPAAPYVENIGVYPDIEEDYMTLDNLMNYGDTFVTKFTAALVDLINKNK